MPASAAAFWACDTRSGEVRWPVIDANLDARRRRVCAAVGPIWQARACDRGPRQAAAARHALAVLPGVLRRARHDDRAGRLPDQRGPRPARLHRPAGQRPAAPRLVAAMDNDWRPAFRVEALPSYKAHRVATGHEEEVPDALSPQVAIIEEVLEALGVACFGVDGYEADDVIGTLAIRDPGPVDIVTGDRDLFQLVDDSRAVRILYTARGVGRADVVDEAWVTAKYGIPGRAYADFATLRGDPSDGLPGRRRRRRQDRGRADHEVRLAAGPARGAGRRRQRACRPVRAPSWPRRATTWRSPRRWSRWPTTCRCRRTTRSSRRVRGTRTGWSSSRSAGGWTARSTGCCRRSPRCMAWT